MFSFLFRLTDRLTSERGKATQKLYVNIETITITEYRECMVGD
jgi:hypothetical protein